MELLRKLAVLIIALPILIVGIILIPLPGPGLLICFVGLLVLSLEFEGANRYLAKAKKQIKSIYAEAKKRADKIEKKGEN